MASAGKVSPITRGVWDSTASYTRLDIVTNSQNTKSYICKKDNTNTPLENTEFWQVLVNIGDASGIEYDNTTSGMTATNVKEALDELASKEIELDDAMSDTSENAVKNKAIKKYVDDNKNIITDDVTKLKWRLGIENGNMYYEEVE